MARTKEQKKEIIEKLRGIMDKSGSLVFVNIHGLKVNDTVAMRRKLGTENVGLFVAKKTLTSLALADKKYVGEEPTLPGELALAYGDTITPARAVYEFQKKHTSQVVIVGGVFEDHYLDKEAMTAIAAIPPLSTLHGMFVNIINSPIQRFVVALDQIAHKKV